GDPVARVVGQPLRVGALTLGGKRNRPADLDDHVGNGVAHTSDQLIELGQPLAALAVGLAHMQVQHRRAGVVAVDGLLNLFFHRHRDVLGKVRWDPFRAIGRGGDDELVLVLRKQRSIEEIHLESFGSRLSESNVATSASASSSSSRIGAPRHMLWRPCRLASCRTAVISSFVAPALSARWMWRRTPGAYMCVHDASSAMPMSSTVFASSAPATRGAMAIARTFSVHAGSSLANGSQSGFQLPLARLRAGAGRAGLGRSATFRGRVLRRALAWAGVSRARPAPAHRRPRGDPLRRNVTRTRTAPPPRGRTGAEPTPATRGHTGGGGNQA